MSCINALSLEMEQVAVQSGVNRQWQNEYDATSCNIEEEPCPKGVLNVGVLNVGHDTQMLGMIP